MLVAVTAPVAAQTPGTLRGRVTHQMDGSPVAGATVSVVGSYLTTLTDRQGRYVLAGVPAGTVLVRFTAIGFHPTQATTRLDAGGVADLDVTLESHVVTLGDVIVYAPSRAPEPVVDAPAAVSTFDMSAAPAVSTTSQVPLALSTMPGVDIAQNDIHDFNVNARGYNASLNRRVLVLQDGRDLAIAFLGSQEWSAFTEPLEDFSHIEMVRGPGSALYGANAFNGVLSITTPPVRDVLGAKLDMAGGELSTIRADLRQAALLGGGRFGYRVNVGYNRSATWARSRTGVGDFAREYASAIDTVRYPPVHPFPGFELRPLNGQTVPGGPGTRAVGDPSDEQDVYGGARFDYYPGNGGVITAEGGIARVENMVFMAPVGRTQSNAAVRPWARLAWGADRFHVQAWYSGRSSVQPQYALTSGAPVEDHSHIVHVEAQTNRPVLRGSGLLVLGASARSTFVNSQLTLIGAANDDRHDEDYSAYGQFEYRIGSSWRLVTAARYDVGDLFDAQFSPKGAIVFSPTPNHSIRATVNRAFLTPNTLEFFTDFPAGAPADFSGLEAALRASPLGPALDSVPNGQLFTTSTAVPILARGNPALQVEHSTSFELGYKGQFLDRFFLSIDGYYARLSNFVTDILPGVNPAYAPWTAPAEVPAGARPILEGAVRDALLAAGQPIAAVGLTRLADGSTAIVLSVGNAGRVKQYGLEAAAGVRLAQGLVLEANYSLFRFNLDSTSLAVGQVLEPNTPAHRINLSASYSTSTVDVRGSLSWVAGYDWASGIYQGRVPASATVNLSGGYRITPHLNAQGVVTNLFNQQRYHIFGGSVIGRRALIGMTLRR